MNTNKFLIAVDANDNAMRAVEYTGQVLGGRETLEILLFCVEQLPHQDLFSDEEEWASECAKVRTVLKEFVGKARQKLVDFGVPDESITEEYVAFCQSPFKESPKKCSLGISIGLEILERVKEGDFGTVVVGRRGHSKAEEFLFGSVSTKIIHSAKDCTVWVVA